MSADRLEANDLATAMPDKVAEMSARYKVFTLQKAGVRDRH